MKDLIVNFNLNKTICKDYFYNSNIVDIIPKINEIIIEIGKSLGNDYIEVKENVWINKSANVFASAYIEGPCIIDSYATIRHNAYIRGNAVVGKYCVVGNSTELKNCILFDNVDVPHFNYIGDSILGYKSHLGAGVIISNFKNNNSNIRIDEYNIELRKLGAIIGDYVEVGCNSVIYPGTIIKRNVTVYPLVSVRGIIEQDSIVKTNQISKKNIVYLDFDSTIYNTLKLFEDILGVLQSNNIDINKLLDIRNEYRINNKLFNIYQVLNQIEENIDSKVFSDIKVLIQNGDNYVYDDVYQFIKILKEKYYQVNILTFGDNEYQMEKICNCSIKNIIDQVIVVDDDKTNVDFIDYKNNIFIDDKVEVLEKLVNKNAKKVIRVKRKGAQNYNKVLKNNNIYEFENLLDSINLF